jgi:hypothetical protein
LKIGKGIVDPLRVGAARGSKEENRPLSIRLRCIQRDASQRNGVALLEEKAHGARQ